MATKRSPWDGLSAAERKARVEKMLATKRQKYGASLRGGKRYATRPDAAPANVTTIELPLDRNDNARNVDRLAELIVAV